MNKRKNRLQPAEFFKSLDVAIREGKKDAARGELRRRLAFRWPRPTLHKLAVVASRLDLPFIGIRLLNPVVRHPKGMETANDLEKAAYARCLAQIGAVDEASEILLQVTKQEPEHLMALGFTYVSQWNYPAAVKVFEAFRHLKKADEYVRTVGLVNLANALSATDCFKEADALLAELTVTAQTKGWTLLLGNIHQLRAENWIGEGVRWKEAEEEITAAESLLAHAPLDALILSKWRALLQLRSGKSPTESIAALREVRSRAVGLSHWETVRHCDAEEARSLGAARLLTHVCYGTPYAIFREKLLTETQTQLPESYVWRPSGDSGQVIDLMTGYVEGEGHGLPTGAILHRILAALSSDFYRPLRLATIHKLVYGEHFNPVSSPARVYEGIKRLRQWLLENRLPLIIEEMGGSYRICPDSRCGLRVYR